MSKSRQRGQLVNWKQQQAQELLLQRALTAPALDWRPLLLQFQLQLLLSTLQRAREQDDVVDPGTRDTVPDAAVAHIKGCLSIDKHSNLNKALLVWLLLGSWDEFSSLWPGVDIDDFAAANNPRIPTGMLKQLIWILGWGDDMVAAAQLCAIPASEAARLASHFTTHNGSVPAYHPNLRSAAAAVKATPLGQSLVAGLWRDMLSLPDLSAKGGGEPAVAGSGSAEGSGVGVPEGLGTISPVELLVAQAIIGLMPGQIRTWEGSHADSAADGSSCASAAAHSRIEQSRSQAVTSDTLGGRPTRGAQASLDILGSLAAPNCLSASCIAAALIRITQSNISRWTAKGSGGECGWEVLLDVLHVAAHATTQVEKPEERRALMEAILHGSEFQELREWLEHSGLIDESIARGLILASNSMVSGQEEAFVFEELPAWVTLRVKELTPFAMLGPRATLSRLVNDGLRHVGQGYLVVEVLHELLPLVSMESRFAKGKILMHLLKRRLTHLSTAAPSSSADSLVGFCCHLSKPAVSGGVHRAALIAPDELLRELVASSLTDRTLGESGLRVSLQLMRAILLEARGATHHEPKLVCPWQEPELLAQLLLEAAALARDLSEGRKARLAGTEAVERTVSAATEEMAADLVEDLVAAIAGQLHEHSGVSEQRLREVGRHCWYFLASPCWADRVFSQWSLLPIISEPDAGRVPNTNLLGRSAVAFHSASVQFAGGSSSNFILQVMAMQDAMLFSSTSEAAAQCFLTAWTSGTHSGNSRSNTEQAALVQVAAGLVERVVATGRCTQEAVVLSLSTVLSSLTPRQFNRVCTGPLSVFLASDALQPQKPSEIEVLWRAWYLLASSPLLISFSDETPSGGPSQERRDAVETMLHGIAAFCAAQPRCQEESLAFKEGSLLTFSQACAVVGALQPVYACKASTAMLLQLLKRALAESKPSSKQEVPREVKKAVGLLYSADLAAALLDLVES